MQEVEADRSSVSVSIRDALDSYLRLKGVDRSKTFFQVAERAVGYLEEVTDAEELSSLSALDAARFRDHLIGTGMTAASVRRVFGTVKAITNLAIREYGLTDRVSISLRTKSARAASGLLCPSAVVV